ANDQPADPQGSRAAEGQVEGPCDGAEPAKARRLHPCLYDHPEEAELGAAQGGQGPPDQPARSDQLHPGR
ncbi:MAG: SSU ribosomal protein S12p (S23e), partial [uncultured Sphingomonas sp.]